jgi:hypothetical protein
LNSRGPTCPEIGPITAGTVTVKFWSFVGNVTVPRAVIGAPRSDVNGKNVGRNLYAAGQKPEGQITEVSYMFVRPGSGPKPVPKVSLVTRVADLICGVGYYK